VWQFIKLLLASWFSKVLLLLGIASAVATYIPRLTLPAWIPSAIMVLAVLVASYDVFKKQQHKIEVLQARLANQAKELPLSPGEHKMRQILKWKGKGISVKALEWLALAGVRFGEGDSIQFTVEDCTQFFVTLGYGSEQDTISLQRVEVSFDKKENRLLLEVRAR
jgi:hypothetical protein